MENGVAVYKLFDSLLCVALCGSGPGPTDHTIWKVSFWIHYILAAV
jgi:hypothetical protein